MRWCLIIGVVTSLLALGLPLSNAQSCDISIAVTPSIVHYPYTLPNHFTSSEFGEVVDVNYSSSRGGQTLFIQYYNGSLWLDLQSFTANNIGFTETTIGLDSGWAHYGNNILRASSVSCASQSVNLSILPDESAIPKDVVLYLVIGSVWAALFFILRRARLPIALLGAAAAYLVLSPFTGQRYDLFFLASSGIRILEHVNPFNPGNPPIYPGALKWAYPPLYAFYSALSFQLYEAITGAALPSVQTLTWPGFLTSTNNVWEAFAPKSLPVLTFLLKLPMIVSAVATGWLLMRMTGKQVSLKLWLINPVIILVAAIWGQLDPIATLFAVASVYFFQKDKPYHAYLLASFGAAVKVWPALLLPIFFTVSLRKRGFSSLKELVAILPSAAVTLGLYGIYGNLIQTLSIFVYSRGIPTYAGKFSVNGLTWQQFLLIGHTSPLPVFLIFGIPAYLFSLWWIYRKKDVDVTKWIVVSILIFFMTYNYVNPQYFYWLLPFLILQRHKLYAWIFTALPMLYVILSYNVFYFVSAGILFDEFSTGPSIIEQLKLNFFYATPVLYILVSAALPTIAYLLLLTLELGSKTSKRIETLLCKFLRIQE